MIQSIARANPSARQLVVVYRPISDLTPDPRNARTHPKRQIEQIVRLDPGSSGSPTRSWSIEQIGAHRRPRPAAGGQGRSGSPRCRRSSSPGLARPRRGRCGSPTTRSRSMPAGTSRSCKLELGELGTLDVDFDLSLTGFSTGEIDVVLTAANDPDDEVIPAVPSEPANPAWRHLDARRAPRRLRRRPRCRIPAAGRRRGRRDRCGVPRPALQCADQRPCQRQGPPSRVRDGLGRDERGGVPHVPRRNARRRRAVSRDGAVHFVCMDWRHMDDVSAVGRRDLRRAPEPLRLEQDQCRNGLALPLQARAGVRLPGRDAPHLNTVELGRHGRNRTNVWDYASVNSLAGSRREDLALHPTVKPVALVADAIQDVTRRGDLVLDIFLGSGTTLIAAERTGRRFRGLRHRSGLCRRRDRTLGADDRRHADPGAPHERAVSERAERQSGGQSKETSSARVGFRHHLRQEADGDSERRGA